MPYRVKFMNPNFREQDAPVAVPTTLFDSEAAALLSAKRAADALLLALLKPGMTAADLWSAYHTCGLGFCAVDGDGFLVFSAEEYANARCGEIAPPPLPPKFRKRVSLLASSEPSTPVPPSPAQIKEFERGQRVESSRDTLTLVIWGVGAALIVAAWHLAARAPDPFADILVLALYVVAFFYVIALGPIRTWLSHFLGDR